MNEQDNDTVRGLIEDMRTDLRTWFDAQLGQLRRRADFLQTRIAQLEAGAVGALPMRAMQGAIEAAHEALDDMGVPQSAPPLKGLGLQRRLEWLALERALPQGSPDGMWGAAAMELDQALVSADSDEDLALRINKLIKTWRERQSKAPWKDGHFTVGGMPEPEDDGWPASFDLIWVPNPDDPLSWETRTYSGEPWLQRALEDSHRILSEMGVPRAAPPVGDGQPGGPGLRPRLTWLQQQLGALRFKGEEVTGGGD